MLTIRGERKEVAADRSQAAVEVLWGEAAGFWVPKEPHIHRETVMGLSSQTARDHI